MACKIFRLTVKAEPNAKTDDKVSVLYIKDNSVAETTSV